MSTLVLRPFRLLPLADEVRRQPRHRGQSVEEVVLVAHEVGKRREALLVFPEVVAWRVREAEA